MDIWNILIFTLIYISLFLGIQPAYSQSKGKEKNQPSSESGQKQNDSKDNNVKSGSNSKEGKKSGSTQEPSSGPSSSEPSKTDLSDQDATPSTSEPESVLDLYRKSASSVKRTQDFVPYTPEDPHSPKFALPEFAESKRVEKKLVLPTPEYIKSTEEKMRKLGVTRLMDQIDEGDLGHFINTRVLFFSHNLDLVTIKGDVARANDPSQYEIEAGFDGLIYHLKSEAKLIRVDYLSNIVWRVDENPEFYPDLVEFNVTDPPYIMIRFPDQSLIYRYMNSRWQLQSQTTTILSPFNEEEIKIITSVDVWGSLSKQNDESRYEIKKDPFLKLHYYEFHEYSFCIGINYENGNVWSHDRRQYGFNFPKRAYFHTDAKKIVVEFDKFYLSFIFDEYWKLHKNQITSHFDEDDFEIHMYDSKQYGKVIKNDSEKYEIFKHYFLHRFTFKDGTKCLAIKYKKVDVWTRHHMFEDYYPKSIHYNLENETFFIDFDINWYYVYKYNPNFRKWELINKEESNKPANLPSVSPPKLGQTAILPKEDEPIIEEETHKVEPQPEPIVELKQIYPVHLIQYEPHDELPEFDDEPDFSDQFYIVHQYDENKNIVGLYSNALRIWTHETGGYPKTVTFNPDILMTSIIFSPKEFFVYQFNGVDWIRARSPVKDFIQLDIEKRSSTDVCRYSKQGYIETYIPITDFLIDQVIISSFTSERATYNSYIWKAESTLEYSEKVVVNRHGSLSTRIDVTVSMFNGCEQSFVSTGLREPFVKDSWSETSSVVDSEIFITTADDASGSNSKINDHSKFIMYRFLRRQSHNSEIIEIYKYVFIFNYNSKCILIKYKNEKIWEVDKSKQDSFPSKLTIDLDRGTCEIVFKQYTQNIRILSQVSGIDLKTLSID